LTGGLFSCFVCKQNTILTAKGGGGKNLQQFSSLIMEKKKERDKENHGF